MKNMKAAEGERPISRSVPRRMLILSLALGCCCGTFCRAREEGSPGQTEAQQLRQKIAVLTRQEQVLAAELSLAKGPAPYLALDLANRKVDLKVQGQSLRGFVIAEYERTGGSPVVAQAWKGTEIKPLQLTPRARVVPGSGESTTSSVATKDPWGPHRMPMDYDVICTDHRALEIRSLASGQSRSRFTRWIVSGYRQTRDWTRDLLGRRSSSYRECIEIWLSEDDARLLFWSLPKQFGILILENP